MLIVLPYCKTDALQLLRMLRWIKALGGAENFHALIVRDGDQDAPTRVGAIAAAQECFASVASIPVPMPAGTQWPTGCNLKWRAAAAHVMRVYKEPWFWMEPDCVPLKASWASEIEAGYQRQPRKFMGPFVRQDTKPELPPVSMPAVAVYSNDAVTILGRFCGARQSFDMIREVCNEVLPRSTETKLIQHFWGKAYNESPTFENAGTLARLNPDAVLFHRCKDASLINLLREQAGLPLEEEFKDNGNTTPPPHEPEPVIEDGAEGITPAAVVPAEPPQSPIVRKATGQRRAASGNALVSVFGGQQTLTSGEGRVAVEN